MSRRVLLVVGLAGLAAGIAVAAITLSSDHVDDPGFEAAIVLLVGWSFVGTGLFAWWRRPANGTGPLMAAAGFAWFATKLSASNDDLLFTIGIALDALFPGMIGHLLVVFPAGRAQTTAERAVVASIYFVVTVLQVPSLLFEEPGDPRNLLIVHADQPLSDAFDVMQLVAALAVIAASWVPIVRRVRAGGAAQRRALLPVIVTGGVAVAVYAVSKVFDAAGDASAALDWASEACVATIPFGFLVGLLSTRLAQGAAVSELISRLGDAPGEAPLRAALADALGDPTLALAYWLPDSERFVDALGHPVEVSGAGWTEVELQGRRIAAIAHDPALHEEPQLVRAAGAAAALALENQRLAAELRARIEELRASRARLVEAGDDERRRLERDLHDGAQSRLVALALKLKLARMNVADDSEAATLLDESSGELQASLDELRELARGLHPVVLTDRGLAAAVRILADRAPVAVEIAALPKERLPPPVEIAVYFVVAEALTNVAKYARATAATVSITTGGGRVRVDVADDGVGGANAAGGSGLRGLSDRVAALDGRLDLDSPPGEGTRLRAEIPL
ncbi:MAG TPA: histidine kinase [Solirubrobacteraceae bacterium]